MRTKRYSWKRALLVGSVGLGFCLPVLAAGLAEMVEQAWQRHPLAAGLDARDAEARAVRELADSLTPEPGAVTLGNLNDRQGRNIGKQEWEVELAVPLWLPGQKNARVGEADSRLSETAARRAAIRLGIAGEIRDAWWSLATARTAHALALRRIETARALDAAVQKRFKAGDLSRIDANLAQSERLAAETELMDTQAVLQQAEQAFRLLTGREAPAAVAEEAPATAAADLHPQLALAAATAHSARARVKLADEFRRAAPEIALRVVNSRDAFNDTYANTVGIKLKIPFSSGPQVRRDNFAAQADAEQADVEMRRTELRVQLEAERARLAFAASDRQWTLAKERRRLAADNLQLAEKSFALGESDLASLLRIRASAFEAESHHERQRLARAAAISRLNQSLGVLP